MAWSLCLSCGSPLRFGDACPGCGSASGIEAHAPEVVLATVAAAIRPAPLAHREPVEMPPPRERVPEVVVAATAPHPPPVVEPIAEDLVALPVLEVVDLAEGMPLHVREPQDAAISDHDAAGSDEVEEVTDFAYDGRLFVSDTTDEVEDEDGDEDEAPVAVPEEEIDDDEDAEELSFDVAHPPTVPLAVEEVDDAFDDWLR